MTDQKHHEGRAGGAEVMRSLTDGEMATLGMETIAYVKPVVISGTHAYAIHAADGQQLATVPNRAIALATVRNHDLEPTSVH